MLKSLFSRQQRPSVRRVALLIGMFPFFTAVELFNRIGFLIDALLYRDAGDVQVREPVFVAGVPRSGTTFMHRLLSKDVDRFTTMKLWEIMLAPSVIQKKLFCVLGGIDKRFGGYLKKTIRWVEKSVFKKLNRMHTISLFEAEEDAMLLIHTFNSSYLFFAFPFMDCFDQFIWFDERCSDKKRKRIMAFYRRCIQKHLYVFGQGRQFLSKSPAFCSQVVSLNQTFPDAKMIYLVRNPYQTVPSMLSLCSFMIQAFQNGDEDENLSQELMDVAHYWYQYPLEKLDGFDTSRQVVVTYDVFTGDPAKTVKQIYNRFNFKPDAAFSDILQKETKAARRFKSRHAYSLETQGVMPETISARYSAIIQRFAFDHVCAE